MRIYFVALLLVCISCNQTRTADSAVQFYPPYQTPDTIDYNQLYEKEDYCAGFPLENKTLPLGLNFDMKEADVIRLLDSLNNIKAVEYVDGKSLKSGFNFPIYTRNYSFWGTRGDLAEAFHHDSLVKFEYGITANINKNKQQKPEPIDWLTISKYQNELMEVFLTKYGRYDNMQPSVFAKGDGMSLDNRKFYWFGKNRVLELEIYNPQQADIFGIIAEVSMDELKPLVKERKIDELNRIKKEKMNQDSIDNRIKNSNI